MTEVHFTRYIVEIEIRFQGGRECCEWCNWVTINAKRHFECKITKEEMVSPRDSIGWECPIRKLRGEEFYETDVSSTESR